jgi:allantoinase
MIVSDHSPCPPDMKRGTLQTAWGGIASLSMALPIIWTEASRRGFTLADIARWMSEQSAHLAGLGDRKGAIVKGRDADFVVFDAEAEFTVTEDRLHHRHAVSPYLGETLRGVVKRTYLRGELVFEEGTFPGENRGIELQRSAVPV